jgi:hypothetical protein
MLIIRTQQESRLKEGPRSAFLGRVEQYVLSESPECLSKLDPGALRQFVERNWEVARGFGLQSERSLCLYLEAVCRFGENFPIELDWAHTLLKGVSFEDQKTGELQERIKVAKGSTLPGDRGNGAHFSRIN